MNLYLCPLFRSSIGCLRGGQALQYTALLLINKIIDVLIVYKAATCYFLDPLTTAAQELLVNEKTLHIHRQKSTDHAKSKESPVVTPSEIILPSLTMKENLKKTGTLSSVPGSPPISPSFKWLSCKSKKLESPLLGKTKKFPGIRSESSSSQNLSEDKAIKDKSRGWSSSKKYKSAGHKDDKPKASKRGSGSSITTPLNILVTEGMDLLLNVLNNAITLHKRDKGSKQTCTPSHR